ncbi:SIMPL domain-containing protein [Dialister pneumosintes]|mgnify:FL=1|uniref:DUF541 domain-containing protein n=1 Tax=Dialister pneumosintes TaxID=39950 RepID=A0ABX9MAP5_9FIRM|nr:SIMPL domain-containing protein [Dialister pneumosintes]RID94750.1 DUF541 domain-containing protein [Dialister pneumosintes]
MNKKLIAVLLSGLIAGSFMTVSANAEEHTISVTGNARVLIPADTATFYATVETYSPDAKVASRENAVIMNKVKKAVILAGAIESKLETDSYSVSPEYTYDKNGKRVFKEYEATNSLKIVVDNVKIVGKVMDAAVEAGAMNVHSVNFGVKDRSQYSDRVLRLATQNALHKAEIMAETVGSKVIGTVSLSQSSRSVYAPVFEAEMDLKAVGMRETPPVEATKEEMETTVNAVFQIQ